MPAHIQTYTAVYRAIVCSEVDIVPSPAFFTEKACFNYWYSRMKTDSRIKSYMCYFTGEDDTNFYSMRAVLIEDCLKQLKLIGALNAEGAEEVIAHQLLDLEIVQLEQYIADTQKRISDAHGYH